MGHYGWLQILQYLNVIAVFVFTILYHSIYRFGTRQKPFCMQGLFAKKKVFARDICARVSVPPTIASP